MSTRVQMTRASGEVFVDFVTTDTADKVGIALDKCKRNNLLFYIETGDKIAEYINLDLVQTIRLTEKP